MNSRLTRMLLKLYPRRIRDRYGDELLDLQDELRTQDDVSRVRLIADMLAGALLVRSARQRASLVIGAALVIGGLAVGGAAIGGLGADSPARASHPWLVLRTVQHLDVMPGSPTCFVADGSSCSLTPCTEFIAGSSTKGAVADGSPPATRPRLLLTTTHCTAYPHVHPQRPVFVAG
jgi:hypothetical protein